MKAIKFFCLTGMILFFQIIQAQDANRMQFEKYLSQVYDAYTNGGWQGMKNYYSESAFEIDPQGNVTTGFEALEKNYAMLESTIEGKPKFMFKLTSYKLVKPDVAQIIWDALDEVTLKGGQKVKMESTISSLLVKQNGKWKIESTQLTPKTAFSNPAEDQAALMELGKQAYEAFDARDAKRFANVYAEDVVFISPDGEVLLGRDAVEKAHVELFKQWSNTKKVSSEMSNNTFRVISSDVVISHWIDKTTYMIDGKSVTESIAFSNTCVKKDGKWQSAAFSMTPIVN